MDHPLFSLCISSASSTVSKRTFTFKIICSSALLQHLADNYRPYRIRPLAFRNNDHNFHQYLHRIDVFSQIWHGPKLCSLISLKRKLVRHEKAVSGLRFRRILVTTKIRPKRQRANWRPRKGSVGDLEAVRNGHYCSSSKGY